jgi:membrane protease YdiL (CAAX protease family)
MKKNLLLFEMISLYFIAPLLLFILDLRKYVIIFLLFAFIYTLLTLFIKDKNFLLKENKKINKKYILPLIIRIIATVIFLTVFTKYFLHIQPFVFISSRPRLWLMIMILYPILSVLPQTFIYRFFMERRYSRIIKNDFGFILISAGLFSFAHFIIYQNYIATVFSFIGGIFFAHTYKKSNSFFLSFLEQAIYGDTIFSIGLGLYFYSGHLR